MNDLVNIGIDGIYIDKINEQLLLDGVELDYSFCTTTSLSILTASYLRLNELVLAKKVVGNLTWVHICRALNLVKIDNKVYVVLNAKYNYFTHYDSRIYEKICEISLRIDTALGRSIWYNMHGLSISKYSGKDMLYLDVLGGDKILSFNLKWSTCIVNIYKRLSKFNIEPCERDTRYRYIVHEDKFKNIVLFKVGVLDNKVRDIIKLGKVSSNDMMVSKSKRLVAKDNKFNSEFFLDWDD